MPICEKCGTGVPVGHKYCYECGQAIGAAPSDGSAPPAPSGPLAPATGQPPPPPGWSAPMMSPAQAGWGPPPRTPAAAAQMTSVGVPLRLVAGVIDFTLAFVVFLTGFVVWIIATDNVGLADDLQRSGNDDKQLLVGVLMVGVWYVYAVVLEAAWGTTLGKRAVGLKVVMKDGRRCTVVAALVRNIFKFFTFTSGWALLITLIAILVDGRNRRVGDMAARTFVVKREEPASPWAGAGPTGPPGWGPPPGPPPPGPPPPGWGPPPSGGPPPVWGPPPGGAPHPERPPEPPEPPPPASGPTEPPA